MQTITSAFTGGGGDPTLGEAFNKTGMQSPFYHSNTPYYVDPGPKPTAPSAQDLIDPNTGLLKQGALQENIQLNRAPLNALEAEGLAAPGTSPWEQMARTQQGLVSGQQLQNAQEQGAAQEAAGRSALASHGGLTSGAAERLARGSASDILNAEQTVGAQNAQALGNIGLQAEQMRQGTLAALPGQELQALQPQEQQQQFNIANALQQAQLQQQQAFQNYQEQMRAYAAAQQANAIAASGPKSGGLFGASGPLGGLFGG